MLGTAYGCRWETQDSQAALPVPATSSLRWSGFPYCDFVPTESGLTYPSSNQRSDSDVIQAADLHGSEPENGSIAHLEYGVTAAPLCSVQLRQS